ncbi:MAG: ABC transporter ATP-binding protein [Desulfarculaceae bacterium]|nr:ABC transporter ATP-binding protein [Desulfarculaceae bacterium]MCF8048711.1 ABC transporter ATP-binding protein [Desulfarculaceae bacterium]MCF8065257.1 ABC transporter ATP-binding protein [Desulfarculaceae bacterium]MCF8098936.1 ABC transporter ATP-binding protein [Desulfarculaceae bacterium]MCF8121650.1 ABC transporter ATP-binding protein [Desulfarculaceae bacterium]
MALLEIENLVVRYGSALVLDRVSLGIENGECVAVIGPNGAGKTTLLRSISALKDWEGTMRFQGQDLAGVSSSQTVALGIVQAPEGRHLFPQLSVRENLELGAFLAKDKEKKDANYQYVLELFPRLGERLRQMAGTLSGGEQQMLCVGRALMSSPRILLLDEPSFGLAPLIKEAIANAVRQIMAKGTTILLVEQDAHMAFELAQRVYVLEEGHITITGTSKELSEDPSIRSSYLGL